MIADVPIVVPIVRGLDLGMSPADTKIRLAYC